MTENPSAISPSSDAAGALAAIQNSWYSCMAQGLLMLAEETLNHPQFPEVALAAARARYDAHPDRASADWRDEATAEEVFDTALSTLRLFAEGGTEDEIAELTKEDPEMAPLVAVLPLGSTEIAARLVVAAGTREAMEWRSH